MNELKFSKIFKNSAISLICYSLIPLIISIPVCLIPPGHSKLYNNMPLVVTIYVLVFLAIITLSFLVGRFLLKPFLKIRYDIISVFLLQIIALIICNIAVLLGESDGDNLEDIIGSVVYMPYDWLMGFLFELTSRNPYNYTVIINSSTIIYNSMKYISYIMIFLGLFVTRLRIKKSDAMYFNENPTDINNTVITKSTEVE